MSGPAGSEETHGSQAPQGPVPPAGEAQSGERSAGENDANLPARAGEARLAEPVVVVAEPLSVQETLVLPLTTNGQR